MSLIVHAVISLAVLTVLSIPASAQPRVGVLDNAVVELEIRVPDLPAGAELKVRACGGAFTLRAGGESGALFVACDDEASRTRIITFRWRSPAELLGASVAESPPTLRITVGSVPGPPREPRQWRSDYTARGESPVHGGPPLEPLGVVRPASEARR